TWFMGGVILYFGGHPTQHYLNYPLRLIAWMWQNNIAEETTEPLELFRVKDSEYIDALADFLQSRGVNIHTGVEVAISERNENSVTLDAAGESHQFGEVVLAIQPQCSAKLLGKHASPDERTILESFEYSVDTVAVHQDESYMPQDKSLWRLANIRLPNSSAPDADRSQTLPYTLCAPCNEDDTTPILATYDYAHTDHWPKSADLFTFSHAIVNPNTQRLRQKLENLQGKSSIHYCGSWSRGLTLHEDAVVTGFEAANRILDSKGEYKLLSPPTPMPKPFEALDEQALVTDGDLTAGIPAIETALKDIIHTVMGIDPAELDGETDVQALGMSSLHFAKLANTINANLPPTAEDEVDITMLLQMETLFEVAEYIHEAIHGQNAGAPQEPEPQTQEPHEPAPRKAAPKTKSRRAFIETLDDQRERETKLATSTVMTIQGLAIAALFATIALSANLAFWVGTQLYGTGGIQNIILALPAAWSTYCIAFSLAAVCVKWVVVGKLKPGRYSVYRKTHLKWWIANLFLNFGQQSIWLPFRDSHLGLWLLQLLGARVHSGATLNIDGLNPAVSLIDADLLSIGDRAYIRRGALVQCHLFTEGSFILAPITLEERTVIWTRGVVEPGCTIEKTGILEHHSVLTMGNTLPSGMRAQGVPATKMEPHNEDGVKASSGIDKFIHTFMGFIILPYMMVGAFGVFFWVINTMVDNPTLHTFDWRVWVSLWPAFIITTIILGAACCLFKWALIGRIKSGQLENDLSVRLSIVKFVSFLMMRFALFCPRDLRWMLVRGMGANVAYGSVTDCPLVEVAYADLLTMEEGSFYSPAAYADFAAFRNGQVVLEEVRLESTAYVGAYSTVSAPIRLPPLSLLASTSTLATGTQVESSQVWVGSPAKCVPITLGDVTEDSHSLGGWSLLKNRIIDLSNHYFVVLLMSSVALTGYHLFADIIWPLQGDVDLVMRTLASFAFILFSYGATTFGMLPLLRIDTELLRWLCIKDKEIRTEGFERSTWKFNVWHLLSNHLLPYGMITDLYAGTPLQLWLARRLGATIGKDVYLANGVGIREFTFTHIHDNVMLNRGSALIAHSELPNGRIIMKDINLYPGSSMGFISYIVGGTNLPEGVLLGSLSRPFDSQELDPGGEYDNTPCKRREK
ncbi:MAG: hypothetical protein HOK97_03635, partial [Deltaproteobacteria bacterium]|nr:hypothetical protein [Deltaproteobacteria bacterium]